MILVKAPLRISFVGGGTDLPEFYRQYPGRVISATINKSVYLVIKPTTLVNKFIVRYQNTEVVSHPKDLQHSRVRAALLDMNLVNDGIEIGSFADIPAKTGLGSSSSFSVALMKGLNSFIGKKISKQEAAELACKLEIDILGEPIGKQDQYASAFGGFNIFQFNANGSVDVESVLLDYKKRSLLENHLLLFFTGITRSASSVLVDQGKKIKDNFETYKKMSDSVLDFHQKLLAGDIQGMGEMLHEGWLRKRSLSGQVSNSIIDNLYEAGIKAGAIGGKILGAGGGGCLLMVVSPENRKAVKSAFEEIARQNRLLESQEIPFNFTQAGTDILFHQRS
jgi:D-glycero-alpha-D-manno-heptose-7-phosphate kinase